MTTTVTKILNQAEAWLGYSEANGKFKKIIDIYNSHKPLARGYKLKYTDEWCDGFISACAIACGAVDIIGTEVGVPRHVDIFKKKGIWLGRVKPKAGDIVVYDWNGDRSGDHIGYVLKVTGNSIVAIEGNYNEIVAKRTITYNHSQILGYARPKYAKEEEDETENKPSKPSKPTEKPNNKVDVWYRVKTQKHGWLKPVRNLEDYAGFENSPIIGVAIKVNKGKLKYRVHNKNGGWLEFVNGYDINDYINGYAGNDKVIDAIEVYYYTPDYIRPYKRIKYSANSYPWQYDNETTNGQDGYAGVFGVAITKLRMEIV